MPRDVLFCATQGMLVTPVLQGLKEIQVILAFQGSQVIQELEEMLEQTVKKALKETEDQMESVVLRGWGASQEFQAQLDWTAWSVKMENLDS